MPEIPKARSAIGALPPRSSELSAADASSLATVIVRGAPDSNLSKQLSGVGLGRSVTRGPVLIARQTLVQWLYVGGPDDVALAIAALDLSGATSVVDKSHARSLIRMSGSAAAEMIQRWSLLDMADAMFPNYAFVAVPVAGVRCEIIRDDIQGSRSYLVAFDRTYAEWLVERLVGSDPAVTG